jgi:hypothetical protein
MPVEISTTIGDILHNLRSALDSLAYEIARRSLDRPMTAEEERACVFPVTKTPERFDQFFDKTSKHERTRIRSALYGARARAAFRSVQPFRIHEEAILLGVQVTETYEQEYRWSELYRLTQLSNLDKHRRLTLVAWWPDLVYWMSNGPSKRRWLGGDGTSTDGSVLGAWSARMPTPATRCSTTSTWSSRTTRRTTPAIRPAIPQTWWTC